MCLKTCLDIYFCNKSYANLSGPWYLLEITSVKTNNEETNSLLKTIVRRDAR